MAYDFNPFRQGLGWLLIMLGPCFGVVAAESAGQWGVGGGRGP